MSAIWYLYKKSLKNWAKKALKKPMTYLYLVLILIYGLMLPFSMNLLLSEYGMDTPATMAAACSIVVFWLIPANMISYVKRKGLLYKKGDVHFMFPSPITPKQALLYAHIKSLGTLFLINLVILGFGIILFHCSWWQILLYFLVSMVLDCIMEGSMMVILYGSERITEKGRKWIVALCYLMIGVFFAIALWDYQMYGMSLDTVMNYLSGDKIQMVPVVGWYIGLFHLFLVGPTTCNVVASILYFVFTVVIFLVAYKMPCHGGYYEDAMKFAEDFEELRLKREDGQMASLGKKEKFGKAKVTYKGGGAKAIFYKQLLEYKKSKLLFFDKTTILMMLLSAFIGYIWGKDMMDAREFILPLTMGYMVFCMSTTAGKWGQEIKNPYTFLMPDTPMKKLWYSTLLEHIKSFVCGAIIAIPAGIILKLPVLQIALCVIFFVALNACKIYNMILTEAMFGPSMGKTGKQLFQMFLMGIDLGVVVAAAVIGSVTWSMSLGLMLMIGVLVVLCFALMTVANACFDKMEVGA
ncbi:MAG: putative ABC exporter domain-containing protein [Lachnospiraceae bacterium]|nr:putative ABC exporter domain-containing protein [Lachnospiraceae bacterium]